MSKTTENAKQGVMTNGHRLYVRNHTLGPLLGRKSGLEIAY